MNKISIAIDGPAGSGKSSTAKLVAEKLGYFYIDTGKMYRAMTLAWLQEGTPITEENSQEIVEKFSISIKLIDGLQHTFLNDMDVTDSLYDSKIGDNVSNVASISKVREYLVSYQQKLAKEGGIVMDGRDIGTRVMPKAELKIYLIASIEERAKRRQKQLQEMGKEIDFNDIYEEIKNRDIIDSSRKIDPLRKAKDAIELDTSDLSINQQVDKIVKFANKIINK